MGGHWLWAACAVIAAGGCERGDAPRFEADGVAFAADVEHAVDTVHPPGLGEVEVAAADARGQRAGISCATCHQQGAERAALAQRDGHPANMHKELPFDHGGLACASCHASEDPGRLVLAHGERLAMADYMRLCGQCHGPQSRDYVHGSHGGMKGYWDLKRGPRQRNGCLACHAAHAPAYPHVIPAPPPNDRFLEPKHVPGAVFEQRWPGGEP